MDAEQVLRSAEKRSPGLVALALLLSPAVRIEPELIRAVRLELMPALPAGAEGELWFSPLVSARGLDGVVLDAAVANVLRERVRTRLRPAPSPAAPEFTGPTPDDILGAWRLITEMHAGSPPVLRLEERVNWLAVSEAAPQPGIEAELQLAVDALRRGRIGVARWAARALPRMPDAARSTTAAWLLAQGARRRLGSYQPVTRSPVIGRIDDLAALLPARYDVPFGISRFGDRLEIGEVGRGGVSIRVLDTDPRLLAVSAPAWEGEQTVQVRRGARTVVEVGTGPVRLRTPRGEIYQAPPDEVLAALRLSCVSVQAGGSEDSATVTGIAVAPDRVLTVLPPGTGTGGSAQIAGRSGDYVGAHGVNTTVAAVGFPEPLTLLEVPRLPEGVQPYPAPPVLPSPPKAGDRWYGLNLDVSQRELAVTGVITGAENGTLTASSDGPVERPMSGCPMIIDGMLSGMIAFQSGDTLYAIAGGADVIGPDPDPDRLWSLTLAAQAISLEFHLRLGGFRRGGVADLNIDALMAGAGLNPEQLDHVRGAAEWVIREAIETRHRPRWLSPSGPRRFSEAVVAALDQAAEALQSPQRLPILAMDLQRLSLTAAAREGLTEIGVSLVPSYLGGTDAELDVDRFAGGGSRRLREILAEELPAFDDWDPWSAWPAAGADRPEVLLNVVRSLSNSGTEMPEPARTVLGNADRRLYPHWWQTRDDLARLGVPDVGAEQNLPDFLEAYLGWCLTVLHHVAGLAGTRQYEMGFSIPGNDVVALPTVRFGLDVLPSSDAEVHLAGRFSSLVGFAAWVFIELADAVRLAAADPPSAAP